MTQAPNRVPSFVKPEGRVLLHWPADWLACFPSGTQEVGHPRVPLRWVLIEPRDYEFTSTTETWREEGHQRGRVTMRFSLPALGAAADAGESGATHDEPRPTPAASAPALGTAFILHGYGVDLETMLPWGLYLAQAGWRSVLVDLRGHGGSGGRTVHFGTVETNDLRELRVGLEASGRVHGPYVALGHSQGGALALRWPTIDPAIRASVALGAPAEFVPAAGRLRDEYARWLPRSWVRRAAARVPRLLGVAPEALDTVAALEEHPVPAFLVAGAGDAITPPEDSVALRRRLAPGSPFLIVGPTTHELLPYVFDQHGPPILDWLKHRVLPGDRTAVGPVAEEDGEGEARGGRSNGEAGRGPASGRTLNS